MDAHLLQELKKQSDLLTQLLASLNKPKLGFSEKYSYTTVYCNRTRCPGFNWYVLSEGNPIGLTAHSLTGYVVKMETNTVTRYQKDNEKLHLWVQADDLYRLEVGLDSEFASSLIRAIAGFPGALKHPITFIPQPGNSDSVLFCKLKSPFGALYTPHNGNENRGELLKQAIANVAAVAGKVEVEAEELTQDEPLTTEEAPPEALEDGTAPTLTRPNLDKFANLNRLRALIKSMGIAPNPGDEMIQAAVKAIAPGRKTARLTPEELIKVRDKVLIGYALPQFPPDNEAVIQNWLEQLIKQMSEQSLEIDDHSLALAWLERIRANLQPNKPTPKALSNGKHANVR